MRTSSIDTACTPASTIPSGARNTPTQARLTLHQSPELRYSADMPANTSRLTSIVEEYLGDLRRLRASGGATGELSTYPALSNLLNAIGATLRPKVFCVVELADQGAGHPDIGLYAASQVQRGTPRQGQTPECGVVEVKQSGDDAWLTAEGEQVSRYWNRYRLCWSRTRATSCCWAATRMATRPDWRRSAWPTRMRRSGPCCRDPERPPERWELHLASTCAGRCPIGPRCRSPATWRGCWLHTLGTGWHVSRPPETRRRSSRFARHSRMLWESGSRGERGDAFFRSTLVQTLFYGIFSGWVLWSRQTSAPSGPFNWHDAALHLRVPVLESLFGQVSIGGRLRSLDLIEVLEWTAAALNRVERKTFFERFDDGQAVQYFYEPFLEAFDPALRKQLGVWYTPSEVVKYMVARVDMALRDDLGIEDGLAAENVYVLDPCCGTGAYVSEVLRRIAQNLRRGGTGALTGARVKEAATRRVFGFEIMPAPFVVAHLQVGLTMRDLDAPLSEDGTERAGIFLTNALTGWEPTVQKPLPFPELEEERDRADRVKKEFPDTLGLFGVLYPDHLRRVSDVEAALKDTNGIQWWLHGSRGRKMSDIHIHSGSVSELSDQIRALPLTLEGADRVLAATGVVGYAVERAAGQIAHHARVSHLITEAIARTDKEKDRSAARRIGCLVLFNAMAFHDRLASINENVPTIRETWRASGINGLQDAWVRICKEIDYVPVFELAGGGSLGHSHERAKRNIVTGNRIHDVGCREDSAT